MRKTTTRELATFGMLGGLMYASKVAMEGLPNVHLLGVFTITLTVVYGWKALYPIYTFVVLLGLMNGFALWWIPYLYLWTILWAVTMVLPKNLPARYQSLLYMTVCGLHGLCYGVLYAPAQALLFGLSWDGMIAWILAGLPFDCVHGVSNFLCGTLIVPMISAIRRIQRP